MDRWRRLVSRMGQSVWPGKKIGGQRANRKGGRVPPADLRPKAWFVRSGHLTVRMHGHQLQCMVKRLLKLFRRGFFFPRCAAVGCLMVRERAPSCLRVALLRPWHSARPPRTSSNSIIGSAGTDAPTHSIIATRAGSLPRPAEDFLTEDAADGPIPRCNDCRSGLPGHGPEGVPAAEPVCRARSGGEPIW